MKRMSFYARYALTILIVVTFLLPLVFRGARKGLLTNRNDVSQWLPETYEETQVYKQFRQQFVNEEFILASWPGCTLEDPRLELLAQKLVPLEGQRPGYEGEKLFATALTGPRAIAQMTAAPLNLERDEAISRLEGALVGHDRNTTCLVLTLSEHGKRSFRKAVEAVYFVAAEQCAVSQADLRLGGPPVDNVAIDKAGEQSLLRLAVLSAVVGIVVSWWSLRSGRLLTMVFATAIYSVLASLAVVYYSGQEVNAILLTMPSLVYVATTSGAIHLANYYRDRVRDFGREGAAGAAIRHAALPLALAASTTAVGLLTLCVSELVPIQAFGLYSAVGVLISLLVTFLVMPASLELWPIDGAARTSAIEAAAAPAGHDEEGGFWHSAGEFVTRRWGIAGFACLAVMGLAGYGLTKIETSVQLMRMFSPGTRILEDYAWLEKNVGELVPMEIVLRVNPEESHLTLLERLEMVEHVQRRVAKLDNVGSALSAVTFAPNLEDPGRDAATDRAGALGALLGGRRTVRSTLNKKLEEHYDLLKSGDFLRVSDGKGLWPKDEELWRVTARVEALGDVDYGHFVRDIGQCVEPVLAVYRERQALAELLEKQDRRLSGAKVLVVGVQTASRPKEPAAADTLLLLELLRKSGAKVAYNDPQLASLASSGAGDAAGLESVALTPELLGQQDLVLVTPDTAGVDLKLLKEHAPKARQTLAAAAPVVAGAQGAPMKSGLAATYTGLVPLVYKAQHSLLDNLIFGFFTDMLLISVTMIIAVRDVPTGLVLLVSSAFPSVIVFGIMGWLGVVVDTGTVMAPSVALGVTVDDIVHYLLWYRQGQREGLSRAKSVMLAYKGCARAMYQSWGVIGIGLSVFAVSPFTPTQRFGMLMLTLLTTALVGNLVLLPALLASPLGGLFRGGKREAKAERPLVEKSTAKPAPQVKQTRAPILAPPHIRQNRGVDQRRP
ncbi:MAG: MMPL family transporter [Pirellulales bacterium]